MGNYHTNADLKARFEDDAIVASYTGSDTAETGVPDEAVLTEIVAGTESEVDSYIARRYLIPVAVGDHTGLAARMKSVCLDVSVYHLVKRGDVVPQSVKDAYDAAIEWCKLVGKGEVVLPSPDTEASSESDGTTADWGIGETSTDEDRHNRVFTRDTLGGL